VKPIISLFTAVVILLAISAPSRAQAQTEVSLLVANPIRRSIDKIAPGFESKTGYKLKITYGKGLGTRDQIARGDKFDVSLLLPPYPEALASGNIDPKSETTLASLLLGIGVRKGAPKPDISTPEALKKTLLSAKTIAFVDPMVGSDGFSTQIALQKLGILDQIASKIKLSATASASGELVAKGDAELCIYYVNEMTNPGTDVVGLLPKQFATPVKVVAFISTHAGDAKAARALLDYLSSPEAEASYRKDGLEPAR
jgi:molybdate transport system substrate-binding protein